MNATKQLSEYLNVKEGSAILCLQRILETNKVDFRYFSEIYCNTTDFFLEGTFYTDGWHQICQDILSAIPEGQRADYKLLVNELGEKIGREWAKNNEVRRIDNSQLLEWGDRLKEVASEEPERLAEAISNITVEVEIILD